MKRQTGKIKFRKRGERSKPQKDRVITASIKLGKTYLVNTGNGGWLDAEAGSILMGCSKTRGHRQDVEGIRAEKVSEDSWGRKGGGGIKGRTE